jgi:hypothetical protein
MEKKIRTLHIIRLVLRSVLFVAALIYYIIEGHQFGEDLHFMSIPVYGIIWVFFVLDMVLRMFPSRFESMGCQKEFKRNFLPDKKISNVSDGVKRRNRKSVLIVALVWIMLNVIFVSMYYMGIIDKSILLLISLFYSVCDIICILFYCPFQSIFMKNRCCVNCRIYNWDYIMMFTPIAFIRSRYTLSLFALAVLLLVRWEVTYYFHPEYFTEETNQNLRCANCKEHLCFHKKAIRDLAKQTRQSIHEKAKKL